MQNESPALKLFYYHAPAPKTFVYLACYNCVYDVYSSLYDTMQLNYWCTKAFRACSYWPTDIIFFRATNEAKPTGITNYRAAITIKQLSCIIIFYHDTILPLKLC